MLWVRGRGTVRIRNMLLVVCGLAAVTGQAGNVPEDFERWSVTTAFGTFTNSVGWVLHDGCVRPHIARLWTVNPHGGALMGGLREGALSGDSWLRAPYLGLAPTSMTFWAHNVLTNRPAAVAVQISTDSRTWRTAATVTNTALAWTLHRVALSDPTAAWVRLFKLPQPANSPALALDDVEVCYPSALDLSEPVLIPGAPTSTDAIAVTARAVPAGGVSNVALTCHFRFGTTGSFHAVPMAPAGDYTYRTTDGLPRGHTGTLQVYVSATHSAGPPQPVYAPGGGADAPVQTTIAGAGETVSARQFIASSKATWLIFSEIMYHPAARADGKNLEYVELYNTEPLPHDLGGYRLAGDIGYTFPAGSAIAARGYVVVAADPAAVEAAYGLAGVCGPYTNALPNAGGTVRLRNPQDALFLEVTYSDSPPWPVAADGAGHALALSRPDYGEGDCRAWAAGGLKGGTPGFAEPTYGDGLGSVRINEWLAHTDPPQVDGFELYNAGTQAVDIGGCWLSDDASTNRYRVPPRTLLPADGYLWLNQDVVGFNLSMSGDEVFLTSSNGARVVDAVRFGAQRNGQSSGRCPDGSDDLRPLATFTPGAANGPERRDSVVINELMYHPISGVDADEYIELHNRGAAPVNLTDWALVDGVNYTFPTGTTIAAGGYLVVAKDAARLLRAHPGLAAAIVLGDYSGSLSDRGERVELARPDDPALPGQDFVTVDEVTYNDGWGQWSDGGGSSLELVDPRSDNDWGMNWAGSDETAKAAWTIVDGLDTVDSVIVDSRNELRVYMLDAGECLLDDVEVTTVNGTTHLSDGFEGGQGAWTFTGTHIRSAITNGVGYGGSRCVLIRASDRGENGSERSDAGWVDAFWNRVTGLLITEPAIGATVRFRAKVRWRAGWPHMVLGLRGYFAEAPVRLTVPTDLGTPGAANSRRQANLGPALAEVGHAPVLPAAGQAVRVTCRADDPDGVTAVTLRYRVDPATTLTDAAMNDAGAGADVLPGDGVYSAWLPAQAADTLVAFRISARDGAAAPASSQFPQAAPAGGAPDLEAVVRFGDPAPNDVFDVYRLWLTSASVTRWTSLQAGNSKYSNEPIDLTLVCGGFRAIYNAGGRWRGLWRGYSSPVAAGGGGGAFSLLVPGENPVRGDKEVKLDMCGQSDTDTSSLREYYSYWLVRQMGCAGPHVRQVRVYANGTSRDVMTDMLTPTLDMCERWYADPDPQVYKDVGWTGDPFAVYMNGLGEKKLARYRWNLRKRKASVPNDDYATQLGLVDAFATTDNAAYDARVGALLDARGWVNYFALSGVLEAWDHYGYQWSHNMLVYIPREQRSHMFLYDMDHCIAGGTTGGLFPGWTVPTRLYERPVFRRAYWAFLKELCAGPLTAARTDAVLNDWQAVYVATGIPCDKNEVAAMKSWLAARRAFVEGQLATVATTFAVTSNGGNNFTTDAASVVLSGTAPVDVTTIAVNGRPHPVTFTSETQWQLRTSLAPGASLLQVTGTDWRGAAVVGATDALTVTTTAGVAPAPVGQVVISEIMYHAAATAGDYVELHNRSATQTYDLGGWRLDGVDFTFPYGTFLAPGGYVVAAENVTAYQYAYGNAEAVAGAYAGSLDDGGETLRLLQPVGTNTVVIDELRYDDDPPWPGGADGTGAALQLVDASQDNRHVGNWEVVSLTPGWHFASCALTAGVSVAGAQVQLYLGGAGQVAVDDVYLVQGTVPTVGVNRVTNGGFESGLTPWTAYGNHSGSVVTQGVAHSGNSSLVIVATGAGGGGRPPTQYAVLQNVTLQAAAVYTLSFWYLPGSTTNDLRAVVTKTSGNSTVGLRWAASGYRSPGALNTTAAVLPPLADVWLNELQTLNRDYRADGYGDFDPWLEVYNAGAGVRSLDGLYLTDSFTNLTRWAFPGGAQLGAGGCGVVWADAEGWETQGTAWHAGFRLNPTGGVLAVVQAAGGSARVLDYVTYGVVPTNAAYGRIPDGSGPWRVLHYPTAGVTNNGGSLARQLWLNEFMADNASVVRDPAGQFEDWVELYNAADQAADLSGYALTDDLLNPRKWRFPGGTVIPARGFALVWADNDLSQAGLHAGFKLSKDGESLGLYAPDGTAVDTLTFAAQRTDVSEGRWPDGAAPWYAMPVPTPGAPNALFGVSGLGVAGGEVLLAWPSRLGLSYAVDFRASLLTGSWSTVATGVPAGGAQTLWTNTTGAARGFYRVRVEP